MRCANCHQTLPAGQTVCSICEPEIKALPAISWEEDTPASPPEDRGHFECPACHRHFEDCVQIRNPQWRWWKPEPQLLHDACPHCKTMLQWEPIPPTSALQHRLSVVFGSCAVVSMSAYLFLGYEAFFGSPPKGWEPQLMSGVIVLLPWLSVFTGANREQTMPREQGHYRLKPSGEPLWQALLWIAGVFGTSALLIRAAPSPWVTAIFWGLLGIACAALVALVFLNLRQRRQAKARAAQMSTAP